MEVAAGVQLRLHSAAAHALWPDAKRQPRLARRERHRQKARRRLFGEFSHHRSARRDREDHVHYPLGAPACAAAGEKGPYALFQCHPAHGARGDHVPLLLCDLQGCGQRPCVSVRLCVHGVCGRLCVALDLPRPWRRGGRIPCCVEFQSPARRLVRPYQGHSGPQLPARGQGLAADARNARSRLGQADGAGPLQRHADAVVVPVESSRAADRLHLLRLRRGIRFYRVSSHHRAAACHHRPLPHCRA